jgi:transposase
MAKIACPKCNSKKLYKLQSGKRRCARCRYEFIPHKLPLTFTRDEWKQIIHLFLMEQSSNSINEQTGFEQRRILRALTKIRFVMMHDVPEIFSGTVEVDETYLGGQRKNKRKTIRDKGTKRGRGTEKQPVFGILCRNGTVWADVVELIPFNHLSHKKYQKVLSFVPIPGKLTPGSQPVDMFIVFLITLKGNTPIERAIISMGLKDSGVT